MARRIYTRTARQDPDRVIEDGYMPEILRHRGQQELLPDSVAREWASQVGNTAAQARSRALLPIAPAGWNDPHTWMYVLDLVLRIKPLHATSAGEYALGLNQQYGRFMAFDSNTVGKILGTLVDLAHDANPDRPAIRRIAYDGTAHYATDDDTHAWNWLYALRERAAELVLERNAAIRAWHSPDNAGSWRAFKLPTKDEFVMFDQMAAIEWGARPPEWPAGLAKPPKPRKKGSLYKQPE